MKIFDFEEIKNNLKTLDEIVDDDITAFEFTEEELKNGGIIITLKEK